MRVLARGAALSLAAGLALSGCQTPAEDPGPARSTGSATETTPAPLQRAGRQLTPREIEAALPRRPPGTKEQPAGDSGWNRSTDPAECIDVLRQGRHWRSLKEHSIAKSARAWSRTTDDLTLNSTFSLASYSRPVGRELLDSAGAALSSCASFSVTGEDASGFFDLRVLAEPRTATTIGEQTFALRLTSFDSIEGRTQRIYIDYLVVRVGHNLIQVSQTSLDETRTMAGLEKSAAAILTRMGQAG